MSEVRALTKQPVSSCEEGVLNVCVSWSALQKTRALKYHQGLSPCAGTVLTKFVIDCGGCLPVLLDAAAELNDQVTTLLLDQGLLDGML